LRFGSSGPVEPGSPALLGIVVGARPPGLVQDEIASDTRTNRTKGAGLGVGIERPGYETDAIVPRSLDVARQTSLAAAAQWNGGGSFTNSS
jgi:hypothetical protein